MFIANLILLANTPTPGLALASLRVFISLPVAFIVGRLVVQRENPCSTIQVRRCTSAMHRESGLQINALTGRTCIYFVSFQFYSFFDLRFIN